MSEKLVTIVIPTYNRADYLKRTILSAIHQTYSEIEIIVCDNCSSDNTEEIVNSLIAAYPDKLIRFLRHSTNLGPVANWFSGIQAASGAYIKILFSDDILFPKCVEKLLKPLLESSHAFSYGKVVNRWEGSHVTNYGRIRPGNTVTADEYIGYFFSPVVTMEDYPISPCAALFKKEVLCQIPLEEYRDIFGIDIVASGIGPDMLMFLYSFLLSGESARFVNEVVAAFEGHKESITITSGTEKLDTHNFAGMLRFFHLLPPESQISSFFRKYFDQLVTFPNFFCRPHPRMEMLRSSGYYVPTPRHCPFPVLPYLLSFYRRLLRAIEVRTVARITEAWGK